MALQQQRTFMGFVADAAYIEVTGQTAIKAAGMVIISFIVHKDSTKTNQLETRKLHADYTTEPTVAWAYAQLKAQPEFADAIDV